jgi:hypothetical protein
LPVAFLLLISILSGCAAMAPADPEASYYATPRAGSRVEVREALNASPGTRVSLQHGRLLPARDLVTWQPYCQFHVLRAREQLHEPLVIEPDTFIVTRAYRQKDVVGLESVQYAFLEEGSTDNSPSQRMMSTYLELSSDLQPDVFRLVCQVWDDPYFYNHLSIRDIEESLGELVRLATH